MNVSSQLYRIQKIDTELDQVNQRLLQIEQTLKNDQELVNANATFQTKQTNHYKALQNLKTVETDVSSLRIKREISEASLYGGKIRNPKELQGLQEEIRTLTRRIEKREDEQLEAMILLEEAEKNLLEAEQNLKQTVAKNTENQSSLKGEQGHLLRAKDRLSIERNAAVSSVNPEILQEYERLRTNKRGLAIAIIIDGTCSSCGATLRPAELQLANSSQSLVYCSSCGRIYYAG
jgi:uncharacterized protein